MYYIELLNTIFVEPLHHLDLEVSETVVKLRTMSKCKYVKVKGLNNPDIAVFMECIDELIVMSNKLIDDLNELCKHSYNNVYIFYIFLLFYFFSSSFFCYISFLLLPLSSSFSSIFIPLLVPLSSLFPHLIITHNR